MEESFEKNVSSCMVTSDMDDNDEKSDEEMDASFVEVATNISVATLLKESDVEMDVKEF